MVQDVKEVLKSAGIRPSYQRVQILKTLRATDKHPTAEELLKMVNSASDVEISRATLYNTLQLFIDNGIIVQVDTNSHEAHYEPNVSFHPHFVCTKCKRIFDVKGSWHGVDVPEGFVVHSHTVNVSGVCRECSETADN